MTDIRAAADKALAAIMPLNARVAVVGGVITENGRTREQLGFALKIGEHWRLTNEASYSPSTGFSNAFYVVASW
jgi:hypothetical protein